MVYLSIILFLSIMQKSFREIFILAAIGQWSVVGAASSRDYFSSRRVSATFTRLAHLVAVWSSFAHRIVVRFRNCRGVERVRANKA